MVVAIGLPVLAGGRGGLAVFAGPSAGFLYSWPIAAFVTGLLTEALWRRFNLAWALVATLVGGIGVVYAIGIPFISVFSDTPLPVAFTGSLVFVPGDVVKAVVAALVAVAVRRAYPVIERPRRAPVVDDFVVTPSMKMASRMSCGTPGPESRTRISRSWSAATIVSSTHRGRGA